MKFTDLILTANRNLFRNKLRTTLTVLAIFVGAFTLTITNAIGDSLSAYIEKQVKNYEGAQVLFVHKHEETPDQNARSGVIEYKEDGPAASVAAEIDPKAKYVSFSQIENLVKEFPGRSKPVGRLTATARSFCNTELPRQCPTTWKTCSAKRSRSDTRREIRGRCRRKN